MRHGGDGLAQADMSAGSGLGCLLSGQRVGWAQPLSVLAALWVSASRAAVYEQTHPESPSMGLLSPGATDHTGTPSVGESSSL